MLLNVESLETRLNPAPTFDWAFNSSYTPDSTTVAYGAFSGGGPRAQVQVNGQVVFDEFAYDPEFRGGVDVSLHDTDNDFDYDLVVGAGAGGGPHVRVYLNDGHDHFTPAYSYFAGDPASRSGVFVDHGVATTGYRRKKEIAAPLDRPAILTATVRPDTPAANPAAVNQQLTFLPPKLAAALKAGGFEFVVFRGRGVTVLPEYASLTGVLTDIPGDGDRTFDDVVGLALGNGVILSDQAPEQTLHEVGHVVRAAYIAAAAQTEFKTLWANRTWPSEYEQLNVGEAFAEAFRRWCTSHAIAANPPGVNAFLDAALAQYL